MSELPIKVTLKAGTGYDAPWITVDGANPEDTAFKLDALIEGDVLDKVIQAANLLKAANNAAPILPGGPDVQQQSAPAPVQQQQPAGWGNSPQQSAPQWSGAQQGGQQQQQGGGGGRPQAQQHPEGNACDACGTVLEFKKTSNGKVTWTCPSWRWNNGNPNEHTREWA